MSEEGIKAIEEMEGVKGRKWKEFGDEIKKVSNFAGPMVAVTVLQYLLQVVGMIMVGHLGQLSLSSVAIAISLTNVTGFSLLSGMAGGLETLCGQAFGAQQFNKLGTYTLSAMISLILICPPICLIWIFMDKILIRVGQDPLISLKAQKYSLWLIPGLFGGAILKPLTRYLQTQSLILPMLWSSFGVMCFHVPLCWGLVYKVGFGSNGAALAFTISTWLNVVILGIYAACSKTCGRTRMLFGKDAFYGIKEFFQLGVPSAVMVCLKWWSLEIIILLSGLLQNPKLETSVLSICLTISTLHFTIPYAFGAAASTRVSNELGGGNPKAARMAVFATSFLCLIEAIAVSTALVCSRHVIGYAFSNDKQVVNYLSAIGPLLSLSLFMDSVQAVLSGVSRGSGWQHIGAYINLGAFYMIGLPISLVLGFVLHLRAKGFWIGILIGSLLQSILLSLITALTNWKKQENNARRRILNDGPSEK